ncbi:MAG: hypothetical protein PHI98_01785 [Eubacteriales bacterium]|nr:hypothetical protein [Eubacteriales bacterium]
MSSRVSPFAALTGEEKQMKWLEYQSIKLPYVHGSVDDGMAEALPPAEKVKVDPPKEAAPPKIERRQETGVNRTPLSPTDFQKIRHRQYDAVIAKMKQAEAQTKHYQSLS